LPEDDYMGNDATRKLRYAMVGGGPGSFIGGVHRASIALNGSAYLVAGCFSQTPEKNRQTGRENELDPDRVYDTFQLMAEKEALRKDKPDFVVITAQNYAHYDACKAFLSNGFHVMCEKPLTTTVKQALELKELSEKNGLLLGVSYTYAGHVMVMEARNLIKRGELGEILVVMGEYPQDWLIGMVEGASHGISSWRLDPVITGGSNCTGDIGTHVEHTVSYMTGLRIKKLCAVLDKVGDGTVLDNNAHVLIKYENGATGTYWSSQVAIGNENALRVRIYGTEGAIEFDQENCNYLTFVKKGRPHQILSRGCEYLTPGAVAYNRIPPGHLEGHHVAFANLYVAFIEDIRRVLRGEAPTKADYPGVDDGVDGVKFIEKCLESANNGNCWVSY